MTDETPRIHIDSDWKAQAQAEKEKLAAAEAQSSGPSRDAAAGGPEALPPAEFRTLVGMLTSQALMGLGTMRDPDGRGVVIDLEGSRFAIDLLAVLEEKTKGNLSDEEQKEISQVLGELRGRFVQVTQLVAQQAAAGKVGAVPPGSPGPGPSGSVGPSGAIGPGSAGTP